MSNAPKFDPRGANIGNLAEIVQGDQIAYLQNLRSIAAFDCSRDRSAKAE
jgi:hypothetical protein